MQSFPAATHACLTWPGNHGCSCTVGSAAVARHVRVGLARSTRSPQPAGLCCCSRREMWAFCNDDAVREAIHAEPIHKIGAFDECGSLRGNPAEGQSACKGMLYCVRNPLRKAQRPDAMPRMARRQESVQPPVWGSLLSQPARQRQPSCACRHQRGAHPLHSRPRLHAAGACRPDRQRQAPRPGSIHGQPGTAALLMPGRLRRRRRQWLDAARRPRPAGLTALIYSGDHDMAVPHTGSEAWTAAMGSRLGVVRGWAPWHVGDRQVCRVWACRVHGGPGLGAGDDGRCGEVTARGRGLGWVGQRSRGGAAAQGGCRDRAAEPRAGSPGGRLVGACCPVGAEPLSFRA